MATRRVALAVIFDNSPCAPLENDSQHLESTTHSDEGRVVLMLEPTSESERLIKNQTD